MTVPFESSLLPSIHTRILKKKLYESDDSDVNDIKPIPAVITPSIPCDQVFVWLFFFTYALLAVVYVSHVEERFFNTPCNLFK
jgi:hypothetical protein